MPELNFQEQSSTSTMATTRSGFRARDASPDSVIFTLESNLSLFSSASASVDRCSFASDAHDHDSIVSEISLHLAGHDVEQHESSSGPDLDPNKPTSQINKHRKRDKVKVQKEDSDADVALDSARSSFSLALKECQERRSRSEVLLKKLDRRRPASLDLNNATASSPRLGTIKKASLTTRRSGNFPSPGTPNYRHTSVGMQKGWSSERVPSHSNVGRKHGSSALSVPFNNGKTLPSKWEDAERWIFSPVSGDGAVRSSYQQPQRRPKSKSGPLGPPGVAYYSLYSPAIPMFDGGNMGNFMASSPFSAGVIAADGIAIHPIGHGGAFPARTEPCMARSVSVHGCSEMLSQSSMPVPEDENLDGVKDAATNVSRAVSRRDMATQMSPEGSSHSSPKTGPSSSDSNPSILPLMDLQSGPSCKLEIRDVQVDERVTVTRWSKKHRARIPGKGSEIFENWKKKDADARSPAWDLCDTTRSISKVKREEAKITAWENLQKAKAEAAIRKLEMKLEKKRSSSMDKIMKKLRSAQKRAQEMRSSAVANQAHQVSRSNHNKAVSFRRTRQMSSLSGCFTCHAF
ncbi:Remorin, C-terminal [Trema orientale]|uniref:Remorin, C-terminal n=1 Tax=Trema orientale TaxID=63057 RepID=A0A2P5F8T7_TREOI|nr:Remorin, C-terminal [Trema orientale]